ncbi:MAG TPA: glutathione S-transferase [Burkholderiales bacterium]|nr:glutathione S-transferase [Burkholderiales bacterium]
MRYELYYWSGIQGRGEFVRLALEDAGADYVNREPVEKKSMFAPPFLRAGALLIGQTANILHYLGPRLRLAPKAEPRRLWLNQQQLTIADWLVEVHDTHHPIASSLYYEDQRREAKRRAAIFRKERLPKFMQYFEKNIQPPREPITYVDLSLFQMIEGLRFAFPEAMSRLEGKYPKLLKLHRRVAERPRIAAYLGSGRRIPFNQLGIFRHYPELDG